MTDGQVFGIIGIAAFVLSGLGWGIHDAYHRRTTDHITSNVRSLAHLYKEKA